MSKILTKGLFITGFLFLGALSPLKTDHFYLMPDNVEQVFFIQENSINPVYERFSFSEEPVQKIRVILTAYSSSPDETWGDPFITASGERVRTGVIANNCLPFGTIIEINGLYFEVLDRKNSRYGCEWIDIWKPSKQEAINFGIKEDYANILKN